MSHPTGCRHADAGVKHLKAAFLEILPRIRTHAEVHFRHLRCPGRHDDAVAEVVAVAWKWFLRLNEKGKDPARFVTTFAFLAALAVRSGLSA